MNQPDPHIPFPDTGSYSVRPGNVIKPLVDGIPTFRRISAAVEAAQQSVWVIVAFIEHDLLLPGSRGSLFDMLDRAAARGLDVRVIFWRPNPEAMGFGPTFGGTEADRQKLQQRGARFRIRWDRHDGTGCHHQKCWLIDAGEPSEIAFVGGINPSRNAGGVPGHAFEENQFHDIYVELVGPSASDVHHNFVQRWNEASERGKADGTWGHDGNDELAFPVRVSVPQGAALVQIQRTIHVGHYSNGHPPPGGRSYDIEGGEQSVLQQYLMAIAAARRTIYLEHQALPVVEISTQLEEALKRGVDVALLAPAEPEAHVRERRKDSVWSAFFERIAALGAYGTFSLFGLAAPDGRGGRRNVNIHSKAMLVDDAWATIGSCNLHAGSLFRNTEMNVSFWDPATVRALRCELLAEHLGEDTTHLDDRAALDRLRRVVASNRRKRDAGDADWQGLAVTLDPATYGL